MIVASMQPIAIVLGSDRKPAKVRLISQESNQVMDVWFVESELADLGGKYIKHNNGKWVINTYNWLPVVDMYNNIVRDGTVVLHSEFLPAGVAFLSTTTSDSKPAFSVCDAKGSKRNYDTRVLWNLANENVRCDIFCNLDYNRLMERGKRGFYPLNGRSHIAILDTNISNDILEVKATMMQQGVSFKGGYVELSSEFFKSDTVFIPETWSQVKADSIQGALCKNVCFPVRMYEASLGFQDCKQLKGISLPEEVVATNANARFTLYIRSCDLLEELVLPRSISCASSIRIEDCKSLKVLKTVGNSLDIVKQAVLKIRRCPNLEVVDTKNYEYDQILIEKTPVNALYCQSRSFIGYVAFRVEDCKPPRIFGIS